MPVTRASARRQEIDRDVVDMLSKGLERHTRNKSKTGRENKENAPAEHLAERPPRRLSSLLEARPENVPASPETRKDGYESSDSFERAIVWSAKKPRRPVGRPQVAPIAIPPLDRTASPLASPRGLPDLGPPEKTEKKVTYSPVLASVLQQGQPADPAGGQPAEMPTTPATHMRTVSTASRASTASAGSVASAGSSASRKSDSRPRPPSFSSLKKKVMPKKAPTVATPFRLHTQTRARDSTTPADARPVSPSKPVPRTSSVMSFRRMVSNSRKEAAQPGYALGHPPSHVQAGPAVVQKKRSALFEREQVVRKSLSNLSIRSNSSSQRVPPADDVVADTDKPRSRVGSFMMAARPSRSVLRKVSAATISEGVLPRAEAPPRRDRREADRRTDGRTDGRADQPSRCEADPADRSSLYEQLKAENERMYPGIFGAAIAQGMQAVEEWARRMKR
ncbi:uncharacterized protein V1510DRAFT_400483 [Dipodascopsis tothii]|uniref:uncharacterized protein n=1 Tax=Dipodascopsis tothii TaxID=44089 RepID=UPI0034CF70FB